MTRPESTDLSTWTRLLGALLLAIAFNLAFAVALGSVPTQAQRYAMAHAGPPSSLAQTNVAGRHHLWYA